MKLRRLLNAPEIRDLRKYRAQQAEGLQQLNTTARIPFCEDLDQLIAKPLLADAQNLVGQGLDRVAGSFFQLSRNLSS